MKKRISIILSILLPYFINTANAQSTDRMFNDANASSIVKSFIPTSDGGRASVGYNTISKGSIVKLSSDLHLQWAKNYSTGGPDHSVRFTDMMELPDHGFIVLFITDSTTPAQIYNHMSIMRTDSAGNIIYVEAITDSLYSTHISPCSLISITDTTYYILYSDGSHGNIGVSKMHIDGTILKTTGFRRILQSPTATPRNIIRLVDGNFLITSTDFDFISGNIQLTYYLLDDDAVMAWSNTFYATVGSFVIPTTIQMPDQTLLTAGGIGFGGDFPILIKFNTDGLLYWAKRYVPTFPVPVGAFFTLVEGWDEKYIAGGVFATSITNAQPFLLRIDSSGNVLSNENYPHSTDYYATSIRRNGDSLEVTSKAELSPSHFGFGIAMTDSMLQTSCSANTITFNAVNLPVQSHVHAFLDTIIISAWDLTAFYTATPFTATESQLCNVTSSTNENISNADYDLIPNPVSDYLYIKSYERGIFQLDIYNVTGEIVYSCATTANKQIDLQILNPGIYFAHLITENKTTSIRKIIVQ